MVKEEKSLVLPIGASKRREHEGIWPWKIAAIACGGLIFTMLTVMVVGTLQSATHTHRGKRSLSLEGQILSATTKTDSHPDSSKYDASRVAIKSSPKAEELADSWIPSQIHEAEELRASARDLLSRADAEVDEVEHTIDQSGDWALLHFKRSNSGSPAIEHTHIDPEHHHTTHAPEKVPPHLQCFILARLRSGASWPLHCPS